MSRAERRKNPDYRIAELEAELERLREENQVARAELEWWDNLFPGEEEIARLHRIEEAARDAKRELSWLNTADGLNEAAGRALHNALTALRAALENDD